MKQINDKDQGHKDQMGKAGFPGKTLAGAARPTPTERATLEPTVPNAIIHVGPGLGKAPLWWHADLCEDIFKIR